MAAHMPLGPEQWRGVYDEFDPVHRVEFDEGDLFVARPGSVAASIVDDLQLRLNPLGKWTVCGSMGTGKSSELVHLARQLWQSHAIVGLDLPRSVARVDRLQPAEVLYLIGLAAVRAAGELWGHPITGDLIAELHASFTPLLGEHSREIRPGDIIQGVALLMAHAAGAGPAVAAAAAGAARAAAGVAPSQIRLSRGTPLGGAARPVVEGDPDLERLQSAVDNILAEVGKYRPPVVLVDGLDKIQELRPIRDLFSGSRVLALPQAPVIYTGPITLMLATEWQAAAGFFRRERLTNVVVRPPSLARIDVSIEKLNAGQMAMRRVVEHRLRRRDLSIVEVFDMGCLERLIEVSGGLMRDLIHLVSRAVRWCLRHDAGLVSQAAVEEAITELRHEFEITLNTRRIEELVHVASNGEPSGSEVSAELLLSGYVLPYVNGNVWFEPHPLLRGLRPGL
jgi:hypothetical protein